LALSFELPPSIIQYFGCSHFLLIAYVLIRAKHSSIPPRTNFVQMVRVREWSELPSGALNVISLCQRHLIKRYEWGTGEVTLYEVKWIFFVLLMLYFFSDDIVFCKQN